MQEHRDHVLAFEGRLREAGRALELEKIVVLPLEIGECLARKVGRGGRCDERIAPAAAGRPSPTISAVFATVGGTETDRLVESDLVIRQPDRDVDQRPPTGRQGVAEEATQRTSTPREAERETATKTATESRARRRIEGRAAALPA
jgi:hypothetical protein